LNLAAVQKKPSAAFWFVLGVARPLVGFDLEVVQPDLAVFDARESTQKIRVALPDTFDLCEPFWETTNTRLYPAENPPAAGFSVNSESNAGPTAP
jgi:hypothetical protein